MHRSRFVGVSLACPVAEVAEGDHGSLLRRRAVVLHLPVVGGCVAVLALCARATETARRVSAGRSRAGHERLVQRERQAGETRTKSGPARLLVHHLSICHNLDVDLANLSEQLSGEGGGARKGRREKEAKRG